MICRKSSKTTQARPASLFHRGFTVVEVAVSASIFVVMAALVLGMVVFQSRFGVSLGNYSDMNTLSRQVMSQFEQDMRLARTVTTASPNQVVVTVMKSSLSVSDVIGNASPATDTITYNYDATTRKLTRNGVTQLDNLLDCQFLYFNPLDSVTTNTSVIKKVLMAATMRKSLNGNTTGVSNSDYLVSAIVTMRCRNNR